MDYSTDTRQHMIKTGEALGPDGNYPIRNRADLANAIMAFGRANNTDKPRVKAHIRKRARALGATDLLPDSWTT